VLQQGSRGLAEVLPNAQLRELKGTRHVKMNVLAPVLAEFFTQEAERTESGAVERTEMRNAG
jgi:hypothetical protein